MAKLHEAIQQLLHNISGEVIVPGDPEYEQSSSALFAKGAPAVIAMPKNAEDIAKIIAFARDNKLPVSVRNGGHSPAGHSTNIDGLVIDMRHFNEITVIDEVRRIVRIGAGTTWEMVAKTLQSRGWAISSGDTKTVGVAGLTLAGGIGWMVRRDGLAIDNLVAAELVTADGRALHASDTEHPDLFWAIRGGGGNFGIATYFEFIAQPVDHVFAGSIMYDMKDLQKALRGWRDFMRTAPEDLTTMFFVMPALGDRPAAIMIMLCHAGGEETEVTKIIEPLLNVGTVTHKDITRKPYADVLEAVRAPNGMKVISNNAFIQTLNDKLINSICEIRSDKQMLQFRSLGGAIDRMDADATAFAHRGNEVLLVAPSFVPLDATETAIEETLAAWQKLEAFSSGAYCGFLSQQSDKAIDAAYPKDTYKKLAHIKKQYDPENLFNQNYNIKPS